MPQLIIINLCSSSTCFLKNHDENFWITEDLIRLELEDLKIIFTCSLLKRTVTYWLLILFDPYRKNTIFFHKHRGNNILTHVQERIIWIYRLCCYLKIIVTSIDTWHPHSIIKLLKVLLFFVLFYHIETRTSMKNIGFCFTSNLDFSNLTSLIEDLVVM